MNRHQIGNVISVLYSFVRLNTMKLFCYKRLKFKMIERISPNVVIDIDKESKCILGNKVRIHSGSRITSAKGGIVEIGSNARINNNCRIACRDHILIEEGVEFGPGIIVYDHDHDYRVEGGIKAGEYVTSPVRIGKNTWIGANTIILSGTEIGENCVVGAGCIIKGKYQNNQLIVQKRNTETRFIGGGGYRLVYLLKLLHSCKQLQSIEEVLYRHESITA